MPVTTLAGLPFVERPAWELLGLVPGRSEPDPDHDTAGWCRLPAVTLEDDAGGRTVVEGVLLLGLHSRDDADPLADDIELEFVLRDADETYSAVARLSEFLRARLAGLVRDASAVVLALCNPQRASVARPPGLGERPLYYADGDVTAWMQRRPGARGWTPGEVEIILAAQRWHVLPAG
jgi:hypothetical protein